jgi:hypothetical protein
MFVGASISEAGAMAEYGLIRQYRMVNFAQAGDEGGRSRRSTREACRYLWERFLRGAGLA